MSLLLVKYPNMGGTFFGEFSEQLEKTNLDIELSDFSNSSIEEMSSAIVRNLMKKVKEDLSDIKLSKSKGEDQDHDKKAKSKG